MVVLKDAETTKRHYSHGCRNVPCRLVPLA